MDNKKGAQGAPGGVNEKQGKVNQNNYRLPINVKNLLQFKFEQGKKVVLSLEEIALFNAFVIKAAKLGNGFQYSIKDARAEFGIRTRIYRQLIDQFENTDKIITTKIGKNNYRSIVVNFDMIPQYIYDRIKKPDKDFDAIVATINDHQYECEAKQDRQVEIKDRQVESMINELRELFNKRRKITEDKKLTTTELIFTSEQKKKLKKAIMTIGKDAIFHSALSYFDAIIEGIEKPNNIAGYFLSTNTTGGDFSIIIKYLDKYSLKYELPSKN